MSAQLMNALGFGRCAQANAAALALTQLLHSSTRF
jgi:hypothetical protein